MPIRIFSFTFRVVAFVAFALSTQLAGASVLFENSVLHDFQASGPIGLTIGQNASVCVTNVDESPLGVLVALLQADTGNLLAAKEATLQAGEGTCLTFTSQPNQQPAGINVVGIVVPNGHLSGQGAIVQDRPSGGCITASLLIQSANANNLAGQTLLYAPLHEHHEHVHQRE